MKKVTQLIGIFLVVFALLGMFGMSGVHAQTVAPHKIAPLMYCQEGEAEVVTLGGHECLGKGSRAFFFHVTEIHNRTDVTVRFSDRTAHEIFRIAPGESKTFEDDKGVVNVPLE